MDEKTDTKTATKTKITLNLKDIRDASRVINQNSMLNLDVAESFIERINAFNEEAIRYKNNVRSSIIDLRNSGSNLVPERIHRTITISGGRGSGKTTFLLSNLNKLSSEKNKTIEILDILDPTLIEQKDHLFVNIISRIKQRVQAKMTQDGNRTGEYKEWEKSLRQLAEGLPMLDGVAGKHGPIEDCWADPVFIMEKGLKEVKAANQLEQNFHWFIYESLKFLDKSSFVLAFDDIDMNFQLGWQVLEIIRKYLTTPQLITIIAGDLGLYSMMIREQQWANFSKTQLERDGKQNEGRLFENMVNHLEMQYFLKVLRVEYRYRLSNLYDISRKSDIDFIGRVKQDTTESWAEFSKAFFNEWHLYFSEDISNYQRALFSNPLRSVLQILNGYVISGQHKLQDILIDTFLDDLISMDLPVEQLRSPDPRLVINHITIALVKTDLIEDGYRLKPEFGKEYVNNALMTSGLILTKCIENHPHLVFDLILKLCLTREYNLRFVDYLPADDFAQKKNIHYYPHTMDYSIFTGIYSGEDLVHITWMSTGYFRSSLKYFSNIKRLRTQPFFGSILLGKNRKGHDSLEEVYNNSNEWQRIFLLLPAGRYTDYSDDNKKYTVFSFLPVLAIIGEMLKIQSVVNETENIKDKKQNISPNLESVSKLSIEIVGLLQKFSQIRNFPLPSWYENSTNSIPTDEKFSYSNSALDSDQDSESIQLDKLNDFSNLLVKWMKLFNKDFELPVHTYSRLSSRFFATLNEIDNNPTLNNLKLGDIMHWMVVAFMSSTLIEEAFCKLQDKTVSISLSNPVMSDYHFIKNLDVLIGEKKKNNVVIKTLSLSKWILLCPLLLVYLKPESPIFDKLKTLFLVNSQDSKYETYLNEMENFFATIHDFKLKGDVSTSLYDYLNQVNLLKSSNPKSNKMNSLITH